MADDPTPKSDPDDTASPYDSAAVHRARDLLEATPTTIGRYRVLERLGHGGMGEVYVAEQTTPIKRRVALKIIKAGMDTRQVVARFEAERQALAMMDHPNIARVFDAGTTDTGRPYFVMELVRGVPITQYCDDAKLSTRQRVQLMVPVCQAVQHAHQKGIIHRDIKPTNVLVTLHDGQPVPKVIDFGIAKATHQSLTDKTVYTEFRAMIGTPAYMSPEQAEMSGLDIDTRSDIYSLGVLMYELLTGTTPFDTTRLVKAGLIEIQRIIKDEDPPKPSLRISTMKSIETGPGETSGSPVPTSTLSRFRGVTPDQLHKQLRGELDWIVMKALEKDRKRRYDTASDFAADLNRHLAGEPIVAAPPSAIYLTRKFVRKHRGEAVFTAAVSSLLILGLAGTTWQWRASQRTKEAEQNLTLVEHQVSIASEGLKRVLSESVCECKDRACVKDHLGYRNMIGSITERGRKKYPGVSEGELTMRMLSDEAADAAQTAMLLLGTTREALDAAETEAYIANLALAQAAMDNDNWPEARERLSKCPESKRGWEWRFLSERAKSAFASVDITNFALSFDPGKAGLRDIRLAEGAMLPDGVKTDDGGWYFNPQQKVYARIDDKAIKLYDEQLKPIGLMSTPRSVGDYEMLAASQDGTQFYYAYATQGGSGVVTFNLDAVANTNLSIAALNTNSYEYQQFREAIVTSKDLENQRQFSATPDGRIAIRSNASGRELAIFSPLHGKAKSLEVIGNGAIIDIDLGNDQREIWDTRPYAERQKDRDARFNEIPAAKEYVQNLLATDTPTEKLKDAVRNDASISTLRKLVVLEQLTVKLREKSPSTRSTTSPTTLPATRP